MLAKDNRLQDFLKLPFFWSVLISALSFTVYLSTLSNSVYFGDSAEFIVTAFQNGVPHPPGFPLFVAIAHQFTKLPWHSIAWRVNLVSAVFGALSVGFVFGSLYLLTRHLLISTATALFYAFAPLFWLYSLVAEVFSLNNFFIALLLFLVIYTIKHPEKTFLFPLIAFVFGLGLTGHQVLFFFAPALFYLFFTLNIYKKPRLFIYSFFAFVVGEIPQFYLWHAASGNPFYNWGDPETPYRLIRHILRLDYGVLQLGAFSGEQGRAFTLDFFPFYISSFLRQMHILLLFIPFGLFFLWRVRSIFWLTLISFLSFGPVFLWYAGLPMTSITQKGVGERFHMQSFLFAFLIAGVGIFFLWKKLRSSHRFVLAKKVGGALLLLAPTVFLLWYYYPKVNQRNNTLFEEYAQNVFETLPKNALFLVTTDSGLMGSNYLQQVKDNRPDLKIVNFTLLPASWYHETLQTYYPKLSLPGPDPNSTVKDDAQRICQEYIHNQATFIDGWSPGLNPVENKECTFVQKGLVIQLLTKETQLDIEAYKKESDELWGTYLLPEISSEQVFDYRTRELFYVYSNARTITGLTYLAHKRDEWAKEELKDAWNMSKDNGLAASNLAALIYKEGKVEEAIALEHQALSVSPGSLSSYRNLGLWYAEKNEPEKAKYYLSELLNRFPNAPDKERIEAIFQSL